MSCHNNDKEYEKAMAKEHANDEAVSNPISLGAPRQAVSDQAVVLYGDAEQYSGYLAMPESTTATAEADAHTNLPSIIVIHEWWGLNDQIKSMARQIAGEGYVALAVNLFGKEAATDVKTAQQYFAEALEKKEQCMEHLKAAAVYLKNKTKSNQMGVIGWCLGGMFSLQTALAIPDTITACVVYYGMTETDKEKLNKLSAPLLGIFGGADQGITVDSVQQFKADLAELNKDATIHIYDGADHAFANPTGIRFNKEAAMDAWSKTCTFFESTLQKA